MHYIQPELFPILNDATKAFFKTQGLPVEYPALITRVPELSQAMGVKDLGLLDAFAWGQQDDQASDPKGGKWRSANWIKKISRADWELFFDAQRGDRALRHGCQQSVACHEHSPGRYAGCPHESLQSRLLRDAHRR
ncbi:MAG: hypothetical protein IPG10_16875 [Flavobacteriales bacterium]|nr:hypothetical protein [Flavobacteriales bacterium]